MRSPLLAFGVRYAERLAAGGEERPFGVGKLGCEEVVVGYVDPSYEQLGEVGDEEGEVYGSEVPVGVLLCRGSKPVGPSSVC